MKQQSVVLAHDIKEMRLPPLVEEKAFSILHGLSREAMGTSQRKKHNMYYIAQLAHIEAKDTKDQEYFEQKFKVKRRTQLHVIASMGIARQRFPTGELCSQSVSTRTAADLLADFCRKLDVSDAIADKMDSMLAQLVDTRPMLSSLPPQKVAAAVIVTYAERHGMKIDDDELTRVIGVRRREYQSAVAAIV